MSLQTCKRFERSWRALADSPTIGHVVPLSTEPDPLEGAFLDADGGVLVPLHRDIEPPRRLDRLDSLLAVRAYLAGIVAHGLAEERSETATIEARFAQRMLNMIPE